MSDGASIQVAGLDSLLRELVDVEPKVRKRILLGGCAKAAKVLADEARRRAPVATGDVSEGHPPPGTLKRAIYQARMVGKCTPTQEVWFVDVRKGKRAQSMGRGGATNLDAYYASWVEFGHYARPPKGVKKTAEAAARALGVRTWVPPRPFMRPAFEAKKGEAMKALAEYLRQQLPFALAANQFLKAA
jgi:HK97 gp10 family phage protein